MFERSLATRFYTKWLIISSEPRKMKAYITFHCFSYALLYNFGAIWKKTKHNGLGMFFKRKSVRIKDDFINISIQISCVYKLNDILGTWSHLQCNGCPCLLKVLFWPTQTDQYVKASFFLIVTFSRFWHWHRPWHAQLCQGAQWMPTPPRHLSQSLSF